MKKNNTWENFLRPVVVLVVICVISSAALAVTNQFTAPVIAAQKQAAANAAYLEVLPEADGFEEITEFKSSNVTKALKATNGAGWVIEAYGKGFGGDVPAVVAFDGEGAILKVKFMENAETAGFGQKLADPNDADAIKLAESMVGKTGTLENSDVDMIGGVTVSSKAAVSAVNAAVNCFNEVALGKEATVEVDTSAMTPEQIHALLAPGATLTQIDAKEGTTAVWQGNDGSYVIYTEDQGYEHAVAPMTVVTGFAADGTITGVWVDASTQTAGIGDVAAGAEYLDQYKNVLGEAGLENVDTVAGSTQSTRGVKKAVRKAIKAYIELVPDSPAAKGGAASSEVLSSQAAKEARAALVGGAELGETTVPEKLTGAWIAENRSVVLSAEELGYEKAESPLTVMVGFDAKGTVTGVWVDASGQTAGIGDKAAGEEYLSQYTGISEEAGLDNVDIVAGSTQSTRGVKKAVRKCIKAYAGMDLDAAAAAVTVNTEEVRAALVGGAALSEMTVPEKLTGAWIAENGSVVLSAEELGYENAESPLTVMVGFDAKGTITGVWVDASGQTAGIGDKAAGEEYLSQYTGISEEAGLDNVDIVAGSTQSTRGVKKAVRKCIKAYAELDLEAAAAAAKTESASSAPTVIVTKTPEEARADLVGGAALSEITVPEKLTGAWKAENGSVVLSAEELGYENAEGPMTVMVGFDANGTITGVWVDASSQTAGIGDKAAGEEYLSQYTGISEEAGLDNVDIVAGSTQSTRGVKKAVRKCIKAYAEGLAS